MTGNECFEKVLFADAAMPRTTEKSKQALEERKGLIAAAIAAIKTGKAKSIRIAAEQFDLPYSTLKDHYSKLIRNYI